MKCSNCGAEVKDDDKFCTFCGNDLEKQRTEAETAVGYCVKCGAPLQEGYKFCVACGAPVSSATPAETSADTETTEPEAASEEEEKPAENAPEDAAEEEKPAEETPDSENAESKPKEDLPVPTGETKPEAVSAPETKEPEEKPDAAKEKKKTKGIFLAIIIVLVLAIIGAAVYFIVADQQDKKAALNASIRMSQKANEKRKIDLNSTEDESYVNELRQTAYDEVGSLNDGWRDPSIMGDYELVDGPTADGDDVVLFYKVYVNYAQYGVYSDAYSWFFTYVKFKNVSIQNGQMHYDKVVTPGYHFNAFNTPDSQHNVQGFRTLEQAENYAM
ncbi:MAG: zinc ribbon domain-containing protein [Oscillospiraceae bacterium]|nr:zinc ribbon domain-containing protein [Oscillospiraceae bacterium]